MATNTQTDSGAMVVKDCGKHYGLKPGACAKCGYFAKLDADPRHRAGVQYSGTPWIAVLGERVSK